MISKRYKRYSGPQENLKQFSLNSSKGIDESKPATHPDSVLMMKNLTVNTDGSLSIRKRLLATNKLHRAESDTKLHILYTREHLLEYGKEFLQIRRRDTGDVCEIVYSGTDYYDDTEIEISSNFIEATTFDLEHATFVDTPSSTIIGASKVSALLLQRFFNKGTLDSPDYKSMLDPYLYDSDIFTKSDNEYFPRYIKISEKSDNVFKLEIHNPELTYLNDPEVDVPVNPNMILDNPYAIRDFYNSSRIRIYGIIPYSSVINSTDLFTDVNVSDLKVSNLTENVRFSTSNILKSFRGVDTLNFKDCRKTYLKVFCRHSAPDVSTHYCNWDYSMDGSTWNPFGPLNPNSIYEEGSLNINPNVELFVTRNDEDIQTEYYIAPFIGKSAKDPVSTRPDILDLKVVVELLKRNYTRIPNAPEYDFNLQSDLVKINEFCSNLALNLTYRFRIYSITRDEDSQIYNGDFSNILSSYTTPLLTSNSLNFFKTDLPNAVYGEKLYYKKSIYSYGANEYDNFIYSTETDSFVTPLLSILNLNTYAKDTVCSVIPWRNHLLTCTENAMYLSTESSDGFYTKTVSTSVGVPMLDRYCVKPALNGVIFKSGFKIYFAYPNQYASDDTVLNVTEISDPISSILEELTLDKVCFADIVNDMYILMVPEESVTYCLVYRIADKLWEFYKYPRKFNVLYKDVKHGVSAIGFENDYEYVLFEDNYSKVDSARDERLPITYGDVLDDTISYDTQEYIATPIEFCLDTGQKTDSIADTRQFVESKLMFSTLSEYDSFPFTLQIAIDGDPHIVRKDVSTDAPFWKTDESKGVLNTSFRLGSSEDSSTGAFNTLRQLVVRYSGKGKSIRHVIEGESLYNFKMYETYVRYKNLNGK